MTAPVQFGRREWRIAYAAALRVLGNRHRAEDAAQDALLRAFSRFDTFDGRGSFDGWLRSIARNCALSSLRKERALGEVADSESVHPSTAAYPAPSCGPDALAGFQLAACLLEGLRGLGELDRLAFAERFLRGTSERELGALLRVKPNAAKQRAFRARRSIRAHVEAAGWRPAA